MNLLKKKIELDETVENVKETVETVVEEGKEAAAGFAQGKRPEGFKDFFGKMKGGPQGCPPEPPKDENGNPIAPPEFPKDENGNPIAPPNGKPPMGFPGGKGPHGPRPKRPGETAEEEKPQA